MCFVTISLDDQPYRRWGHHRRHGPWGHFICLPHPRSNIILRLPYQTPSILTRTALRYLTVTRSLGSLITSFPLTKNLGRILGFLRPGICSVLRSLRCISAIGEEAEQMPLAAIVTPPTRVFEDAPIDWEVCKADIHCISWILDSTTDIDMIFFTVRFAADTIWYPEIARALSPHILANLFFECLLDGRVIPSRSEHASSIGMALASVLSIRLNIESEDEGLRELCESLVSQVQWERSSEPIFLLVVVVLKLVASTPARDGQVTGWEFSQSISSSLSIAQGLWLSRVILQTTWRWRCAQGPTGVLDIYGVGLVCQTLATGGDQMPDILKTNLFLSLVISLGVQVDIHNLYAPSNRCVTSRSFQPTPLIKQQRCTEDGDTPFPSTTASAHHGGEG